eukprot:tig00000571_g2154.t1
MPIPRAAKLLERLLGIDGDARRAAAAAKAEEERERSRQIDEWNAQFKNESLDDGSAADGETRTPATRRSALHPDADPCWGAGASAGRGKLEPPAKLPRISAPSLHTSTAAPPQQQQQQQQQQQLASSSVLPGPVPAAAPSGSAFPFERLPPELLSRVLQLAGPRAAWSLRRVSRGWRAAFAGIVWEPAAPFPVRVSSPAAVAVAAEAAGSGRLLVRGALLLAAAGSCAAGGEGLPALAAALAAPPGGARTWELVEARAECAVPPAALPPHVLNTLEALRPAAPRLARLCLAAAVQQGRGFDDLVPLLVPERLRPLLEPFSALESLQLPPRIDVPPDLAECIAACCPRLRRAALALPPAAFPALSALPLECLGVYTDRPFALEDFWCLPGLRTIVLASAYGRDGEDDYEPSLDRRFGTGTALRASGPALRALADKLPRLARLDALLVIEDGATPEDVSSLARLESLELLRVRLGGGGGGGVNRESGETEPVDVVAKARSAARARALAWALRALRRTGSLVSLELQAPPVLAEAEAEAFEALLGSCCGGALASLDVELAPSGPLVARALEAVAAAARSPSLRRLRLAATTPTHRAPGMEAWEALARLAPLGDRLELRITFVSPQRYASGDRTHYADGRRQSPIEEKYRRLLPSLVPAARVHMTTTYSHWY